MQLHEASPLQLSTLAAQKERRARMAQPKVIKPVLTNIPLVAAPVLPIVVKPEPQTWAEKQMWFWMVKEPDVKEPELEYPQVRAVCKAVAKFYGVTLVDLFSSRRTQNLVRPRQVAMYLAKEMTLKSLPEIGYIIGDRDHSTILHSVRKVKASGPLRCVSIDYFRGKGFRGSGASASGRQMSTTGFYSP